MNVLSLFDGMSCGQIALNRAGIKYDQYYASEIDKYAIQVTQDNYPNTIQLGDITKIDVSKLPKIDLVIGGSPCQSFSNAGSRTGFNGKSGLFWEFIRILNETNPAYFLLENVKMKKEWEQIITNKMNVMPIEINSSLVSAQNRTRLYWTNIPNITQPKDKNILISDIIEDYCKTKVMPLAQRGRYENGKIVQKYEFNKTNKSNALTTVQKDTLVLINDKIRKLTVLECKRLQTVPDDYIMNVPKTQAYKMLGNGWTVDVICHILKNIQ
jgi:DNA (cytosine-5)-methyltransferase 3A